MIKIYGMPTCPDCVDIKKQIEKRENEFEYIDIGSHVRLLKEFLCIRDTNPIFDEAKKNGAAGIPCFVREDGTVTLTPEDVGLVTNESKAVNACSIEDHLNGVSGC